uniref:Envelope glycoprotein n=1 Tax=Small ruminant lentivirus TaxID=254355 RepID=A0A1P8NVQ8_CAEV|nr:envelope glycoprotein [Small ruminant lentivirus]QPZ85378.1 envelope glycoprotein [Small ruminant lentivirus]
MASNSRPSRVTWRSMEPPLRETWNQVVQELVQNQQEQEREPLTAGKQKNWVSIDLLGTERSEKKQKVNVWEPGEKWFAQVIWGVLWVLQIVLWGCLIWEMNKSNGCKAEEVIALIDDPGGFQKVAQVETVPVTCTTKNFTQWGCQPEGAYPDPEVEYRNISQDILKEVYKEDWSWNTYHWPLWQMENMRQWMKENEKEYKGRTNKTKEDIDDLLAGKIRGRFCVPYPFALLKCTKWCWYPADIDEESGRARRIKINCTEARAVSCTEIMPLASIHRAYWEEQERESMEFMNIAACKESQLRCEKRPGGCIKGYPIPVGAKIIPDNMKYLRGKKSQYGGIKDRNGELQLPLTVRVWVKLANNSEWVNGTPPYWENRINGSKGINGTLWGELKHVHHLGFALSYEGKWCNFTKQIKIGQETFPYYYKPTWNCSANWTNYPAWQITRYLDMVEHMTGECVQRPERHNITVGNGTITGNCSVKNWDGCNCSRSGNHLYNSTTGGLLLIICRQNRTITGIMGTNTNWTTMIHILKRNCSGCENATLDRQEGGALGHVKNENCTLPHKNESNLWTCAPRRRGNVTDSLYIAGGKQFWTRVKAQYSCESNIGEVDGMMHQQVLLQKYQVIKVRAYTYGVVEMPKSYIETQRRKKRATELSLKRRKRGIGLVIVLAIMAIIAAAGAGLGVANAVQQSYTRTAVQSLANATAAQQNVLEATYAMVQHVAKGIRILEARVARVEAIVDRMMVYHELDCWHHQHFCVTSVRSEVIKYVNWTRYKNNCTWQQWEEEIEQHEANLSQLLREAALQVHIAQRDASRIPDVWTALQEAFDWSGWFSWLKYIPWIVMGIIGFICFRILMCFISTCLQAYKQIKEIRYTTVTVVIEEPVDLEGKVRKEEDGSNGFEDLKQEKRTSRRSFTQIGRAVWTAWRNSPWGHKWRTSPYMSLLPLLIIQQWLEENGWNGESRRKNKKERVDCQDREQMPVMENDYVELG